MLKVGVTGGIGSGKSVVCSIFHRLNIPIFSADKVAKLLITQNKSVVTAIIKLFGKELYPEGKLNTKALAAKVFNDKEALDQLNAIVHPAVQQEFEKWETQQHSPYIIKEAAILFETGKYKDLDYMITVVAPKEIRIKRVMERDKVRREDVIKRMNNQMTDEEKVELSDYVITNDEQQLVLPQLLTIHHELLVASF